MTDRVYLENVVPQQYPADMTISAHDVAAELRRELPGIGVKKLHKMLYYAQGHHLAHSGQPLFSELISAWDMGPVVGTLWYAEKEGQAPPTNRPLNEAALNTVGYVVSRYGKLTGRDLENLSHSEAPWQRANEGREPGGRVTIRTEWLEEYFRTGGAPAVEGDDESAPAPTGLRQILAEAAERETPGHLDSVEGLWSRLARA